MRVKSLTVVVISLALLAVGCGGASGGPGGGGGGGHPFNGKFVAFGTGFLHTMDLTNDGEWTQRISAPTSYAVSYVDRSTNELYVAELNAAHPMFITVYDLSTFGQKRRLT